MDAQAPSPTRNIPNILRVADPIEGREVADLGFNMDHWCVRSSYHYTPHDANGRPCGTAACIGGTTGLALIGMHDISEYGAADLLGLDDKTAHHLFYPNILGEEFDWETITRAQAASCLRHLAETGIVDWPRAVGMV